MLISGAKSLQYTTSALKSMVLARIQEKTKHSKNAQIMSKNAR